MDLNEIQRTAENFIKFLVNNEKDGKEVDNEAVDKRKLIDEVAGIMKDAGCDDEDIRTAIAKMEKIGYDKSEADKDVDNKKAKKDVKNEDEKDKEKVEELKEDVKKDVDNKCKNGVDNEKTDYYEKVNEVYNAAQKNNTDFDYISRSDRLQAGIEMFNVKEN